LLKEARQDMVEYSQQQADSEIRIGRPLDFDPPGEGPIPYFSGATLHIYTFYSRLQDQDVRAWTKGGLQYGVFVRKAIPFFLLDIDGFGELDMPLNVFLEPEEKQREFFEGNPNANAIPLVLAEYPCPTVRAVRLIAIEPRVMFQIKETLFDQLSTYPDAESCTAKLSAIFEALDSYQMRERTTLYSL
jgi:hypothetical protein